MIRVVLVEPLYPVNIGSVCRIMKNFGAKELYMVRPQTKISHEAVKYAKHALDILEKAKIVGEFENAIKDCDFVVGTTGVVPRFGYSLKSCITPSDLVSKISKTEKIALVFGNEGTGLSLSDLKECDAIVSIPASKKYSVLNLSHAVGILLYEMYASKKNFTHFKAAGRKQVKFLSKMFGETVDKLVEIRDKPKVKQAFDNVLGRSRISTEELQALFVAFGGLRKRLKGRSILLHKPPN